MNCSLRTDSVCEESRPWKSLRPSGHLSKRDGGRDWKREEGRAREARRIILLLGGIRFGEAGDAVVSRLEAISDLEQLEQLVDRLLIVSSWDDLLSGE